MRCVNAKRNLCILQSFIFLHWTTVIRNTVKNRCKSIFCRLSVFGMFPAQPCAVCLCVMEAPCMCQGGWFGLGLGTGESWWVGSWHEHCGSNSGLSKTQRLIWITPIISLSPSPSLSVFPSIDPPSLPPSPSPFSPTHYLSSSLLLLFLLLMPHPSITT